MLDYINNLNFEDSINKDEIFNLYKTKSPNINSIILSKLDCYTKISDFFSEYTSFDINSISKSIDNINIKLSTTLIPNSRFEDDNLEKYINILSTIILMIHYIQKIKFIFEKKVKVLQQSLIQGIINNNLEDDYKDKIIEYNFLSDSALNSENKTSFSNFIENKPKIFNHSNQNTERYFDIEDSTPRFNDLNNHNKSEKNKEYKKKKEDKNENSFNKTNVSSSSSLISMSSILVINKNDENKNKINKMEQNLKNGIFDESENLSEKNEKEANYKKEKKLYNSFNDLEGKNYIKIDEDMIKTNSSKSVEIKNMNHNKNKKLFVEFFKFANDLYKQKYIDETQKKYFKQLIIMYMSK